MTRGLLSRTGTEGDEAMLADLIEEFIDRRKAGEALDPDAFAAEHPDHAEAIRDLIPTVAVMNELALTACREPDPADAGGPSCPEGDRLGDFRILRVIGRGGMAVVYEAEQVSLGRRVALKVLPWAGRPDDRQLARFRMEAYAVAALNHPHIVPLFATGYERGVHYLAMPLIAGRSLAQVIVERRDDGAGGLGAAEAARLGLQAAEALEYAHGMGILHRDVKPANLLVDHAGHLWVVDFGLARVRGRGELTASGDVLGTLRYTSPEQAAGRRLLDQRTDIYAIGATLYELLTLRPAFDGHDRHVLLRQIADDEPVPPRRLVPAIPRDLETIVLKAMSREPQARYESARDLADDLQSFLSDRPVRARRPGLSERSARWARRHRPTVIAVIVVAAMAVAGLAVGTLLLWRERGRTGRQQAQTRENLGLALQTLDQYERATIAGDFSRDRERGQQVESLQLDVIQLYGRLVRQNPDNRSTRLRAARAHHRLANIRAGLILGLAERLRPEEAEGEYATAYGLLEGLSADGPADPDIREETGQVLSDWGWFLKHSDSARAELTLRKALAIQDRLATESACVPRYRLALSQTYVRLSYLMGFAVRPVEVEDVLRRALQIRLELTDDAPGSLEGIAEIHGRLGHLMLTTGRVTEGLRSLDQALAMIDDEARRERSDPSRRRALAELTTRLCCPNLCAPDLTDTLAPYFRRAVKVWEALADDFPDMPDLQEGLEGAWDRYVALMRDAGRLDERESALRQSLYVMERLHARHPTVRRYRTRVARLHLSLAECLDETDRPADALPELERSLELEPGEPRHVAQVARMLAVCPDREGRGPARAAAMAERLLAEKPGSGSLWQTLGLARARAGDWPAAAAALERALSLRGHDLAATLALAIADAHRGDEPKARVSYDEAIAAIADHERRSHRPRARGGYLRRLSDQAAALIDPAKAPGR